VLQPHVPRTAKGAGSAGEDVTPPESFQKERERQRDEEVKGLRAVAVALEGKSIDECHLAFDEKSPYWTKVSVIAQALSPQRHLFDRLEQVTFTPYPWKYQGAWRVYCGFSPGGPYAASEWYVDEERLFRLWSLSPQ
jgi:hypothetical protein